MRPIRTLAVVALLLAGPAAWAADPPTATAAIDRDLSEATIAQLQRYYAERRYSVTQVVRWYLGRVQRYNGVYHALEQVFETEALAAAAQADALPRGAPRGPLFGVPIVIKANTSIAGKVTTDGWAGYTLPGHELVAPRDATVVARLRAAGAIVIGHSNMPDFANSDTNRSSSFGRTGNAYDVRFSPGGSSGGTVTAVSGNLALLGTGTDTGNSIRMPSATSAVIGVFPTRGLVSIAGIAPLDWLLDNTGPIARTVTDAAIALSVMAGEDPLDPVTAGSAARAQPGPYTRYLDPQALKGKRFGVPAFILHGTGVPFHGIPAAVSEAAALKQSVEAAIPLDPRTLAAFRRAVAELEAAGATVVFDETLLGDDFARAASRIATYAYVRDGTDRFLHEFGPAEYHSAAEYERAVGTPIGACVIGTEPSSAEVGGITVRQRRLADDPEAEANYRAPRRRVLDAYAAALERFHLDGFVYPAIQMPPPDETLPQDGKVSEGPHSATSWVNMLGVPAVVVVGGYYPGGLPFGLEFSGRPWHDGDLLSYAYAWEQATHHRRPPPLADHGLLADPP
ncbi:MAG: amidase [Proteobacteria bacterium]|nr:amidase [Pseudomonadota bacterium]